MNEHQINYLKKAQKHAESKSGQCLSTEYLNNQTKMLWKCNNEEHGTWQNTYSKIVNSGVWCPRCSGYFPKEEKLIKAQKHAESKSGQCLSPTYNTNGKLEWKCHNPAHKSWIATYNQVINRNRWCPRCAGHFPKEEKLIKAQKHAESKSGQCLSTEYIPKKNLIWKCAKNHTWSALFSNVTRGTWCPHCSGKFGKFTEKEGLEKAQKHAESKSGQCLSTEYKNTYSKLEWKCHNPAHKSWIAQFRKVVSDNSWCPDCNIDNYKIQEAISKAQKHAESKNGQCLSTKYINISNKLEWKCEFNHTWKSSYEIVVNRNSWCPDCSSYYYKEHKIRYLFEYLFNEKFPKSKPKWNINPQTGYLLELDGYSELLKIAFEFQGIQHYKIGGFNKKQKDLEEIQYRDKVKKENCDKNGIILVIIDDRFKQEQINETLAYILSLIESHNLKITKEIISTEVENIFNKTIPQQLMYLETAKDIAHSKEGVCLSTEYINKDSKLQWLCKEGHKWNASYHNVVNHNSWCPECAGKFSKEEGLLKAKQYANDKGGECLSTEYLNAQERLKWQCKHGHIWNANYSIVNRGSWCSECRNRLPKNERLIKAKQYANDKGGECLSTEYLNIDSKLEWKCGNIEHPSFLNSYYNVINKKRWCKECDNKFNI